MLILSLFLGVLKISVKEQIMLFRRYTLLRLIGLYLNCIQIKNVEGGRWEGGGGETIYGGTNQNVIFIKIKQ